jgi:FlaG/FlaF family flagellin (archaellin)
MKKLALALMAASAAMFGFGIVASAQAPSQYSQSIAVTPNPVTAGGPYTVVYANCIVGDTITFTQLNSTPTSVTGLCNSATVTLTGSIMGLLLPQGSAAYGTATATFSNAPTTPGTYNGVGVGELSPSLPFQFVIPGQVVTTTIAPTTVPATVPGSGLPATGSGGLGTTTGIAVGLLAVGLGLFVVAQVRRRQSPAAT